MLNLINKNLIFLILLLTPTFVVNASVMNSSNYQIEKDSINFAGVNSSANSKVLEDSIGQLSSGDSQGSNYNARAGYQQQASAGSGSNNNSNGGGGNNNSNSNSGSNTHFGGIINISNFVVTPLTNSMNLSWNYPNATDIVSVRIVRSDKFFPTDINDGTLVYEGNSNNIIDFNVKPGIRYYYTIFAKNITGLYSSGLIDQGILPSLENTTNTNNQTLDEIIGEFPPAINIDPLFNKLTIYDFEYLQDDKNIINSDGLIAIDGTKDLTVRLDYNKVPEVLKTITMIMVDPKDSSKKFSFLLRVNKDKTYYEATLAPLKRSGEYKYSINILDHSNHSLKRIEGKLKVFVFEEKNNYRLIYLAVLFILLSIFFVYLIIKNKRKALLNIAVSVLFISIINLLIPYNTFAAINKQINYQGKLTNSSGTSVADGNYNMTFKLYTVSSGGTAIWSETLNGGNQVAVSSGLFSVMLGAVTALDGIDFNQTLYLGVTIESDSEMSPRKIIGSVPSAFTADKLDNLSSEQFIRSDAENATSSSNTFLQITQSGVGKIAEFIGQSSKSVFSIGSDTNVNVGSVSDSATLNVNGNEIINSSVTTNTPSLSVQQTWDNSGATLDASVVDVTNSGADQYSSLLTLKQDGKKVYKFGKDNSQDNLNDTGFRFYNSDYVNDTNNSSFGILRDSNGLGYKFGTFSDNANSPYLALQSAEAVYIDSSIYGGSGTINFRTNGYNTRWSIDSSGNLLGGSDNNYNIGASGNNRPANIYVANTISAGGSVTASYFVGDSINNSTFGGHVGIGTTTASDFALTVAGGTDTRIDIDGSSTSGIHFSTNTQSAGDITGDSNGINFYGPNSDNISLFVSSSDKVGISSTSPNWRLSVNGPGSFDDYVRASYFVSTSTRTSSTFPYASTTAISSSNLTSGNCVQASTGGLLITTGSACGTGAGGGLGWASTTIPNSDSIFSTALSNVGIGTTSPFGKLSIDNRGSNTIPLVVRTNGSPANYTATNTAMIWYDSLGEELFRIFATDPDPTFAGYNTWNTYIGHKAGLNNTTNNTDSGYGNTGVGYNTMQNMTTGSYNASLGDSTLQLNTTGSDNTAIGSNSLSHNTTGSENVGLGQNTLQANIGGSYNVAIGSQALNTSESGAKNVAIGYLARGLVGPASNSDGNTLIGYQSGYSGQTNSNYNTAIGYNSAYSLTTGTYNIALGQNVDLPSNTGSQQLNIGNLIYGTGLYNGSVVSSSPVNGNVGIGTTSPWGKLSVHIPYNATAAPHFVVASSTATDTTTEFIVAGNGNVGIGTASAGSKLTVSGGDVQVDSGSGFAFDQTNPSFWKLFKTGSTIKLFGFGTGVQFQISNSVSGNVPLTANYDNNRIGIASTTPWGLLSVNPNQVTGPSFVIGSSTRTDFIVTSDGLTGIGTTSPYAKLSVSGETVSAFFTATTSTASTFPYASTTALSATTICITTDCRTSWPTGSAFPFTQTTFGATNANSTSTLIGFTAGIYSLASSTIGNGTATGGLTISGGATTTGNMYFGGSLGIGTTSPYRTLSVRGSSDLGTVAVAGFFTATTTTASTFPYASTTVTSVSSSLYLPNSGVWNASGNVGIGSTSPTSRLSIVGGNVLQTASGAVGLAGSIDTSGNAYRIKVVGKYAYVADNTSGLQIIDVSNPNQPVLVGTYDTPGLAYNVYVTGGYAYVADQTGGLQIIDVSNPKNPVLAGSVTTSLAIGVYVSGRYAYVADQLAGFKIFDISNPASPIQLSSIDTAGQASNIFVVGKYMYLADLNDGLFIYDVSNPRSPIQIGNYDTAGSAFSVYVSGKYAYVSDGSSGMVIINVSNPASPTLVSTYATASQISYDVQVAGKYAYISAGATLNIVDVSNPASPVSVTSFSTNMVSGVGVYVSGKYAYIADESNGIKVIDINGIDIPTLAVGNIETNSLNVNENTSINGDLSVVGGINTGISGIFSRGTISSYISSTTAPNLVSAVFMGGKVGIGTTTPYAKLSVFGSGTGTARLFELINSASTTLTSVSENGTAYFLGNMGIGTTSPWRKLSVTGTLGLSSSLSTTDATQDALCINSSTYEVTRNSGAATCTVSSARFKHDINDLNGALDEVMSLRPRSFIYNGSEIARVGFVAEEVVKIDPRFVFFESDGITPRGVRYEDMTSLLAKAVQELNIKVDLLSASSSSSIGQTYIELIISKIKESVANATDWVFAKITATTGVFINVETQTATVKNGIELTDSNTGQIYCLRITNGDFMKTQGVCIPTASTTPIVNPNIITPTPPPVVPNPTPINPPVVPEVINPPVVPEVINPPVVPEVINPPVVSSTSNNDQTLASSSPSTDNSTNDMNSSSTVPVVDTSTNTQTPPPVIPDPALSLPVINEAQTTPSTETPSDNPVVSSNPESSPTPSPEPAPTTPSEPSPAQ